MLDYPVVAVSESSSNPPLTVSGQGNCTPIMIAPKSDAHSPHWPELLISSTLPSLLVCLLILLIWRRSVNDILSALSRRIEKGANIALGPLSLSEPPAGVKLDETPILLDQEPIREIQIGYES